MKILVIHNEYLQRGGEDTVFAQEKELLASRGHEVESLLFSNAVISTAWDKVKYSLKCIYNRDAYQLVRDKIMTFQPDVIHVHNFFYVASPAIFYAAKKMDVPVVMTLHNYRLICPSAFLFHKGNIYRDSIHKVFPLGAVAKKVWNNSFLLTASIVLCTGIHKMLGTFRKHVDGFIVFTEFSRDLFLDSSLRLPKESFFIKPNFSEDKGGETAERDNFFLFVGRLSEEKGLDVLLKACKHGSFNLKILGDGPLREKVEAYAAQCPTIEYLGKRPQKEVTGFMKKAKALIFPSIWYEGMPMVILEAFSCGTPVLASRLGNPESMISEGKDGLFFESKDAEGLEEAIRKVNETPGLQKSLSEGARTTYEKHYSPQQNYDMLMSIYFRVQHKENSRKHKQDTRSDVST